jgi:hypothetical protein
VLPGTIAIQGVSTLKVNIVLFPFHLAAVDARHIPWRLAALDLLIHLVDGRRLLVRARATCARTARRF